MYNKMFVLSLTFIFLLATSGLAAPSTELVEYEVQSPSKASEQLYKGIPINWYSAYALTEFDAFTASPGSDWTWGTSNRKFGPDLENWVMAAKKKNWVTSTNIKTAEVGALFLFTDSYGTCLAIISEIRPSGLYYQMPNVEGLLTKFWLTYDDPMFRNSNYGGLIFPRKVGAPTTNPITAATLPVLQTKDEYKGLPISWAPTYAIMEFDKLVPTSIPWTKTVSDWVLLAQTNGLKISTDRLAAKKGALLVTYNDISSSVAIIREVYPDRLVVSQSVGTEMSVKQIPYNAIKNFVAYIYPEM